MKSLRKSKGYKSTKSLMVDSKRPDRRKPRSGKRKKGSTRPKKGSTRHACRCAMCRAWLKKSFKGEGK